MNVDQDAFITKIAAGSAPGVHHHILAAVDQTLPEGVSVCDPQIQDFSNSWIFVGNRSPQEFALPPGVAYRVSAGSQLVLQTHLFNASDSAIASSLTINLTGIPETEVGSLAQLVEAGSVQIDLPPGEATTVHATCTLTKDVSVFGLLPHMHSLGTTFNARITAGGADTTLYDDVFLGEAQVFKSFTPVAMPTGAPLSVDCNYFNSTDAKVVYGLSARAEMCVGAVYYYPAIDGRTPICLR